MTATAIVQMAVSMTEQEQRAYAVAALDRIYADMEALADFTLAAEGVEWQKHGALCRISTLVSTLAADIEIGRDTQAMHDKLGKLLDAVVPLPKSRRT